jgi:iron complex transport system ATP-binding protein
MAGITGYLLTRSRLQEAREAMHWLTGTVGQSGSTEVDVLLVALAVLVPLSVVLRRWLRTLELGDDTARTLGTRTEAARLALILVGVVLTGLATAVAGPLVFVALVAGPVADRLLGSAAGGLLAAGAVGAVLVLASDYVAVNHAAAHRRGHRRGGRAVPPVAAGHHEQGNPVMTGRLSARGLSLGYAERDVVKDLDVDILDGRLTAIVGANACGKSTLLRGMARLLRPRSGQVLLDGAPITQTASREVARVLGLLPQTPVAPDRITVGDLVSRGRHPHQGWFRQWTPADEDAVAGALAATGTADLVDRPVQELSGGQRQRVWVAMALAQETDLLLLDEPTTFLDINHQVELLRLLRDLNRRTGRTIVVVLHDLNLACRYADHVVAMAEGHIVAEGPPGEVVTAALVEKVFGLACVVVADPVAGTPMIVPADDYQD